MKNQGKLWMPQPLFQNQCFFFCCLLSSTLKSEPTKRYTNIVSITTRDDLQRYIVSYFYKSHRALLLSRNLIKFLKNFVDFLYFLTKLCPIPPQLNGKNFQVHGVQITAKCIYESKKCAFLLIPPSKTYHHPQALFQNLSFQQREGGTKL